MKKSLILILIILVIIGGAYGFIEYQKREKISRINSFEACAQAGFPVMESYPGRCRTTDGRLFTQNIGNELEYIDEILIEYPRPNQEVGNPFQIIGKARGTWFFEGSFSAELMDENNNKIGEAILQAEEEWMIEDFVPFTAQMTIEKTLSQSGTLLLKNANPSGLEENSKTLIVPLKFEKATN